MVELDFTSKRDRLNRLIFMIYDFNLY
jgi:hypothetical protein